MPSLLDKTAISWKYESLTSSNVTLPPDIIEWCADAGENVMENLIGKLKNDRQQSYSFP